MVDTQYLEKMIDESGKTKSHIAKRLGMSRQSFFQKCSNKSDFRLSEVDALCKELNITRLSEKEKIFFRK